MPGWKPDDTEWLLTVWRRADGEREIFKVKGAYTRVIERRRDLLKTGRYSFAWLKELR